MRWTQHRAISVGTTSTIICPSNGNRVRVDFSFVRDGTRVAAIAQGAIAAFANLNEMLSLDSALSGEDKFVFDARDYGLNMIGGEWSCICSAALVIIITETFDSDLSKYA